MKLSILGSGSSGNCSYLEIGGKKILIDVGYSMKKIEQKLAEINANINEIDAIFITHDHGDHIKSFGAISRKYDIDLYVHEKSIKYVEHKLGKLNYDKIHLLKNKKIFLDNVLVQNFDVMHDSAHNLGYSFFHNNKKLSYVTDIGRITNVVRANCIDSDYIAFESNYDLAMLIQGDYPLSLKQRVAGNQGHISNEQSAKFLQSIANNKLKKIFLLHLSSQNNTEKLAYNELRPRLDERISIDISSQKTSKLFEL